VAGCGCTSAPGVIGSGTPRRHAPHTTRPVTVPVAGWAAAPCPKTAALDTTASATTPENLETLRIVGSS